MDENLKDILQKYGLRCILQLIEENEIKSWYYFVGEIVFNNCAYNIYRQNSILVDDDTYFIVRK